MIPRLIHQTWKTETLPQPHAPLAASWQRFNPGWERVLWTDEMLLSFVFENYPGHFEVFCSYRNPVSRADAARYMLLHKFGGLYADIDAECMADLSPIADEGRVVLCHEPPSHWPLHAPYRRHPFVLFNGVMASPPGHPFWTHVLDLLPQTRHATDVLDIAGPCFLTGAYLSFRDKESIAVHPSQLFTPTDSSQNAVPAYGDSNPAPLTRHLWQGEWWKADRRRRSLMRSIRYRVRRWHHLRTRGPVLDPEEAQGNIDPAALARPAPTGDRVAILVPLRDAVAYLDGFMKAVCALDLPRETTKLVFCEGDSTDGTPEKVRSIIAAAGSRFREIRLLKKDLGNSVTRQNRWEPKRQRNRRGGLAVVRNHLIDHGLDETDDWALWIDADIWKFPTDIFQTLRGAGARIAVPNCVLYPGGPTYDLNTFVTYKDYPPDFYYKHIRNGLFQPPLKHPGRLFLDGLRHSECVEVDGVGGTMLLVDASLHRGGLRFPELPYKDQIETEGFGILARDVGVRAVGLPKVEILHIP